LLTPGLIQEVLIARGRHSTCPIASGIIYLGCQQQQQQQQQTVPSPSSTTSTASQQLPAAAAAAAAGGSNGSPAAAAAAGGVGGGSAAVAAAAAAGAAASRQLGGMLHQPWVCSGQGLTSAAAVFTAAEAGHLPPVLDYAASGGVAEWIEFERPSLTEIQQQQQQQEGGGLGSVVLCPALWFRCALALMQVEGGGRGERGGGCLLRLRRVMWPLCWTAAAGAAAATGSPHMGEVLDPDQTQMQQLNK
jgi:hypothetical protein